jgi:alanyl-tRNA synthetase
VSATGDIGPIKIVSEGSIGSNLRRIEAVTGDGAIANMLDTSRIVAVAADMLGAKPDELVRAVERTREHVKSLEDEVKRLRQAQAASRARAMAAAARDGVVVERVDGLSPTALRELAVAVRDVPGVVVVVLGGVADSGGVALVAAVAPDAPVKAGDVIRDAAKTVGGGGGGKGDIATAGGKNVAALDAALDVARSVISAARN